MKSMPLVARDSDVGLLSFVSRIRSFIIRRESYSGPTLLEYSYSLASNRLRLTTQDACKSILLFRNLQRIFNIVRTLTASSIAPPPVKSESLHIETR
jgi:hypothetical protein